MPVTTDDVKRIHASEVLAGKNARDAWLGTYTQVQLALHEQSPSPYPLPPPKKIFIRTPKPSAGQQAAAKAFGVPIVSSFGLDGDELDRSDAEERLLHVARKSAVLRSVTQDDMIAFADHAAIERPGLRCADAVHLAQRTHQTKLWRQARALVVAAIEELPK